MIVELLVHLEEADGEARWWAETDDVPGFSASADSLVELRRRAVAALREIAGERSEGLTVTERLAGTADLANVAPAGPRHPGPVFALVAV